MATELNSIESDWIKPKRPTQPSNRTQQPNPTELNQDILTMSEKPSKHELTILQWLAVAAVAGIVLTVILNYIR